MSALDQSPEIRVQRPGFKSPEIRIQRPELRVAVNFFIILRSFNEIVNYSQIKIKSQILEKIKLENFRFRNLIICDKTLRNENLIKRDKSL